MDWRLSFSERIYKIAPTMRSGYMKIAEDDVFALLEAEINYISQRIIAFVNFLFYKKICNFFVLRV